MSPSLFASVLSPMRPKDKPPASRMSSALRRADYDLVASAASSSSGLALNFCLGSRRDKRAAAAAVCGQEEDPTAARHNAMGQASLVVLTESQTITEKKFGGIAPKKPLFSKDHERAAYFDSADRVLASYLQANSAKAAAIESLKPKLKRTAHHQLPPRKPTCTSS